MVDHDQASRVNGQRLYVAHVPERSVADAANNEALVLTEHLQGPRTLSCVVWASPVGRRVSPGLVQAMRFTPTRGRESCRAAACPRREAGSAAVAQR